ncbi:YkgJ family cysteine cluster protein [Salmonella enterica]|uniref:YkgJ family cysteine cluster protein n=1 Tax=Salmonella enterica TaxID=28901 RepID=UPI003D3211CF
MKLLQFLKSFLFKNTKNIPVTFIDRNETRELPEIPDYIVEECQSLQLKLSTTKNDPFSSLRLIYNFLDTYSKFASTFTVCSKGCSSCCKIAVKMTALEASYIEKCTGHKIKENKKRKAKSSTDCPFLMSDVCSIYEYRPFNCRTFFTIDDPKYCKTPDEPHNVYGTNGGEGVAIIHQFRKYIDQLNGKRKENDIRKFFDREDN